MQKEINELVKRTLEEYFDKLTKPYKKSMKYILAITLLIFFATSCDTKRNVDKEIKEAISEFYEVGEVKDYEPIFYSDFDTILSTEGMTKGIILHRFKGRSNNGSLNEFTHTFDVTIWSEGVIAIPRGFD